MSKPIFTLIKTPSDDVLSAARIEAETAEAYRQRVETVTDEAHVDLVTRFSAAWSKGDEDAMSGLIVEAMDRDRAYPSRPRVMDDLRTIRSHGQSAYLAAA
ncbi:hypothetical protein AB0O20_06495 [Streptomyces kronopolitis]|uniref:hypothetical protein n=1 Tax=Streptomyces kronopolitis TaxID=1612435 RepID=UPI0034243107